ncbi:unnamed protein product [Closterium sp. Yama58-4]|nr:unnamed protein product [Closterium sp. Yama58-4]
MTDAKDGVSLFDHASGTAAAPALDRSQWQTRDAAARLAIRNHLPITERAHFSQHKTAKALYDAVVARYSSPATAAVGRLILPYLFPDLSSFATAEDLISHLRTSDARFRAALPDDFLAQNPPPLYFTLYILVTRLPDTLSSVRDHFLAKDPTTLTLADFEQQLLAAEKNILAVGAARGTPRTPLFEGCSPSPLAPSYASAAAAVDLLGAEKVAAASAPSGKRSGTKGGEGLQGWWSGGGGSGGGGGGGSGGGGGGGGWSAAGPKGGSSGDQGQQQQPQKKQQQQRQHQTPTSQQLHDWYAQRGASGVAGRCPYVIRADLLRRDVPIFDLDYDAILAAMYALTVSAEGDCYLCVPPDPGIETAALGASESALSGIAPAEALHTFTLDSVLARSSTVLPCPAVPSGELSGLHIPSFSTNLVSNAVLQDHWVDTFTPG